jgi:simple sugar transport system permease protein
MRKYKKYFVPLFFFILSILAIIAANVSMNFVSSELYARFIRNGVLVISLLIPIMSGMGINFSISVGAIAAQIAMIIVIDRQVVGAKGYLLAVGISIILAIIFGNLIGFLLNKAKGREMIASMVIGFLGTSLYQLVFMVGYGTIIKPLNKEILLSRGIGLRNTIDCNHFKKLYDGILMVNIGDMRVSLLPVIIILLIGLVLYYIAHSKIGYHMKAVGESMHSSEMLGINVDRTRRLSIVISTVLASLGQLMFIQDLGVVNVYTGHLGLGVLSAAALLVGGATFEKANLKNAYIGLLLFHTLFIVSPLAGQNLFKNAALGEYFRSFIAYGTIVFALMVNLKNEELGKVKST